MQVFKECLPCGHKWFDRDDFLQDSSLEIVGYKVNFDDLLAGTFLFNHSCGATLALPVRYFNGLYEGPIFKERATGSNDCPEYCLYQDQLDKCTVRCECVFVRNIIDIIKKWPKKKSNI
ncbi:MAG: hypothetical protein SWH54_00935 [Thermodesulfobacteriota bacterium]|nr:hypothetical protein [Thermodesulfobacteriota bacterium]